MTGILFPLVVAVLSLTPQIPGQTKSAKKEASDDWIKGEVRYLITEEERQVYQRLATQDERQRFIEEFWRRRDPNPQTAENEFREEYFRRVAYANQNFGAGMAGWLTDRGRIYVLYGPPSRRDPHPMGGRYAKPANQGGDTITTYPFEIWEYDYIPGIGQDLTIEFVDRTGSGMYTLETDPNTKDAFFRSRGAMPRQHVWARAKEAPFERMTVWAKFSAPPPLQFPRLKEEVRAQVSFDDLPFETSTAFVRISPDLFALPLTLSIPNEKLIYIGKEEYFQSELQLYAEVTNLNGLLVYQFDEDFKVESGGAPLDQVVKRHSFHQRIIPLPPGRYKIRCILKDVNSGKMGVRETVTWIPQTSETGLNTSSLIYADVLQPVPASRRDEEFVLGPLKVIPNLKAAFQRRHRLGLYFELYDLEVDQISQKSSVEIFFTLQDARGTVIPIGAEFESRFPEGHSMVISKAIPLENVPPGKYRVVIRVSDLLTQRNCTLEGQVEIL